MTGARRGGAILVVLVLVAFALRVWGVNFGLPYLYYWDEPTVVKRAVRFGGGDLNPHFFFYPALYMYVLCGVSGLYYGAARLTGHLASVQDFAVEFFTSPRGVYMCARVTTALVGAATVAVVYQVGRRFFGRTVGLIAAAILAVSVLHASYSHIAITDVPQAFFITAAYIPIHSILVKPRRVDYLLAGSLIGLGVATKYLAILLVPTLLLAHFLREKGGNAPGRITARELARDAVQPNLLLAFVALGVSFFVASPYNVLEFRQFLSDYAYQAALSRGIAEQHRLLFFIEVFVIELGWPVCLAALVGLAVMVRRRSRADIVFLTFPLVYGLQMIRVMRVFARYMIPEDPFVAILAAAGIAAIVGALPLRFKGASLAAVTAVACAFPALRLIRWDMWMATAVDPRTAATTWTESHVPSGAAVAIEPVYDRTFYNAPLLTDAEVEKVGRDIPSGGRFGAVRDRVLAALRQRPVYTLAPWVADAGALLGEGARYVFVSDLCGPLDPSFVAQLEARSTAIHVFAPDPAAVADLPRWPEIAPVMPPRITIYEVR
jgi:Dolichyl-phosphate-mannose-protein mannosyltransferase